MPSINCLANNCFSPNSYPVQKSQLKSYSLKPQFGMQPAEPSEKNQGCISAIVDCFRNLFRRSPRSAPIVPIMQERTHLRNSRDDDEGYHSLSNEVTPAIILPRGQSQAFQESPPPRQPEPKETFSKPIPINPKGKELHNQTESLAESFIPSSPPEVRREKQERQRKYGNNI